jgi:hypothetical protein
MEAARRRAVRKGTRWFKLGKATPMEKKGGERMAAHKRYRAENRGAAREFDGGGKRCSALIAARMGGARGGGSHAGASGDGMLARRSRGAGG